MKKLPLYFFGTLIFLYCICGMHISDGPSVYVAGYDIYHWTKYDGGYDCIGYTDSEFNIEIIVKENSCNEVEKFFKKIDFQSGPKPVHNGEIFETQDNIYFAGLEPDEKASNYISTFYVLFFDDFTKAISNAGYQMDSFDINNPDSWELNEYYHIIENPDSVKQFFIDKGLYQ